MPTADIPHKWRHRWARWRSWDRRRRRLWLQAWWLLLHTGNTLHRQGYQAAVSDLTGRVKDAEPIAARDPARWETLASLVNSAARYTPRSNTCLARSLVLCAFLRREGVPATVQLGANVDGGTFHAHAWVEVDGDAVNDLPDIADRFPPFPAGQQPPTAVFK